MRFKKAFQNINISRDWIDSKEIIPSTIIPETSGKFIHLQKDTNRIDNETKHTV